MFTEINTQKKENGSAIRVMVYPSKYDIVTGKQETVETIIQGIQTEVLRKSTEKEQLPVAYFSVVSFNGNKTANNVAEHSGLIIIDIDVKDNPDTDFDLLYNNLQWNNYTYVCFRSPSNGIKLIYKTDIKDIKHHGAYYQAIKEYLLNRYKEIVQIDTSGSNVNRACYLPFDPNAFLCPFADIFSVSQDYIDNYIKNHPSKSGSGSSPKPLLQVKYLSYDDHFDNIRTVINKWTSMGIEKSKNETSMGVIINGEYESCICENGTSVGNMEDRDGTSVGLYDCIFNEYRFYALKDSVMSTDVPLFEVFFLKHCSPSVVERNTRLDEIYFVDYPEKRLSTDDFEGLDGLEVCEVKSFEVIKEGKRGKTLTSICAKLIFNNPFCHPALIAKELQSICYNYCEDPHPETNPAPDATEINAIVSTCYQMFINGELDFTEVMRKKKNYRDISKRKVFCSRFHDKIRPEEKLKQCIKTYTDARRKKNLRRYENAITALQDGKKITISRIAEYMGMSRKQVSRYNKDGQYKEMMVRLQERINSYNETLKKK